MRKIDSEKSKFIAETFCTNEKTVNDIFNIYEKISNEIKYQYLAHPLRTIEEAVRKELKSPLFQIKCIPLNVNNINFSCAQYFENKCYIIYFNSNADEKQIRTYIAHELGHLFIEVLAKRDVNNSISEPLSSIFGIFVMLDKNDFYSTVSQKFTTSDWCEIVSDFSILKNNGFLKKI